VQLAKRQGAGTVIATAGSPAKLDFLKQLGADAAINHTRPDWAEQVHAAAPGGVDVALEAVGGDMLHKSIQLLAPFGRVVAFGASAGDLTSVPVTSLFAMKAIVGFSLLAWRAADAEQARADITELTALFAQPACAPSRPGFRWPRRSRHTSYWKTGRCSADSSWCRNQRQGRERPLLSSQYSGQAQLR
jgi:NADPH:quinone reductase-like Zn-dependent oxidoreductase